MKKISAGLKVLFMVFLIVALSVSLTACKGGKDSGGKKNYDKIQTVSKDSKLKVYEGPSYRDDKFYEFSGINMSVNNEKLFMYTTKVNHNRAWSISPQTTDSPMTYFDFEGEVEIKINIPSADINSAMVKPLGYGIKTTISADKKTITFKINRPSQYIIEYNNDYKTAIHLFANSIETDAPDPDNLPDNMIYFGPGVYRANAIPTEPNSTIYLAGGAVVYGQIRADKIDNLTIRGRGILDGTIYERTAGSAVVPIDVMNSKNLKVEGIIISNPAGWTLNGYFLENAVIDNVKIITSRANGDGITLQSCKNVEVVNCFVRGWDDCLVVKNYDRGQSENIVFNNCIIWTDLAQSTEIGYETNGDTMKNIMFRNITVLHNFHKPVISIHNSDDALISNIKFVNYTVEDAQMGEGDGANYLIDFNIMYNSEWSSVIDKRGKIQDVTVDNVLVLAGKSPVSNIKGHSKQYMTTDVNIKNVKIMDKEVRSAADGNISINENNTKNIKVSYKKEATGAILTATKYQPTDKAAVITKVPNIDNQVNYIIPDFAKIVVPEVHLGANITDSAVSADEATGHEAAKLIDKDKNTYWQSVTAPKTLSERAIVTVDAGKNTRIRTIKLRMPDSVAVNSKVSFNIFGVKDGQSTETIVKASSAAEFDPTVGNMFMFELPASSEYRYYKFGFYNSSLDTVTMGEIELYEPSLSLYRTVSASGYGDVYKENNAVDGDINTYWEAENNVYPSHITVDLGAQYVITDIVLGVNPSTLWQKRIQEISFEGSVDGTAFTELKAKAAYTFDPKRGNIVEIKIVTDKAYRYIKTIGYSNSGWKGLQLGEINIYDN